MRGGNVPSSMQPTRFLETPASPTSRSTAIGGHVDIRKLGGTPGCSRSNFGFTFVKLLDLRSVSSTAVVVNHRVSRYAAGANDMNQSLYMSTDFAMSAFQSWGLFKLTGTPRPFSRPLERRVPPCLDHD